MLDIYLSILGHKVTFKELPSCGKWQATTKIALRQDAVKNHWCCAFGSTPHDASVALSRCIEWKAGAIHALTLDAAHHDMLWSLKNQLYLVNDRELDALVNAVTQEAQ